MICAYEDLTPDALAPLGFEDAANACRLLQSMAGHDVPDTHYNAMLRVLVQALAESADPDRAVANLTRWADAVGSRRAAYDFLAAHPPAARILITVLAASQFFANLLIENPEYIEALVNPHIREAARDPHVMRQEMEKRVAIAKTPNGRRDALRRFKGPEVLRIGVRDLLGVADMPTIAREISDFADNCVRIALGFCLREIDRADAALAVIAMGKLGGQELNYSSDIDLIFVHGDGEDTVAMSRAAELVRDALEKPTEAGIVFRVDLRLRPEGRFGPISRSLDSCRAYYESWAEPWERQALIKARAIAGDVQVGAQFIDLTQRFVYPARIEETVIDSIRANKRKIELKVARAGESGIDVKEGIGGIRDIEFTVQLLQLVAGGANAGLRTGNTIEALDRLEASDMITRRERHTLLECYQFLRTVEHRLQLLDERAVRTIPTRPDLLRKCARRLGYADASSFLEDYHQKTRQVSRIFQRLFYGNALPSQATESPEAEIADWVLAADERRAQGHLRRLLAGHGFRNLDASLLEIRRAVSGSEYGEIRPQARTAFAAIAGRVIANAGRTDDPDAVLRGLGALADASASRQALYAAWQESPTLLFRFCVLAAEGNSLLQTLLQHPEFFDTIADEFALQSPPKPASPLSAQVLALTALKDRLRIGARDLWGIADLEETLGDYTTATQNVLDGALEIACRSENYTQPFAIIGMGRLGGRDLMYSSDLDLLYVGAPGALDVAGRVARKFQQIVSADMAAHGCSLAVDSRLRPDGQKGALVLDCRSYERYYESAAATWERHALIKARPVAGDAGLGAQFQEIAAKTIFSSPLSQAGADEIRAMKRRIENERLRSERDLKLAHGGIMDVEWTTQLLQLIHGATNRRLRSVNTLDALRSLRDEVVIRQSDWESLDGAYRLLVRTRNRLFLKHGVPVDGPDTLSESLRECMAAARDACLRLFYGAE